MKERPMKERPMKERTMKERTMKHANSNSNSNSTRKKLVFTETDFVSGDGFLTTVWGPPMWHFLHTMSFNYPVHPSDADKRRYRAFILGLQHVLPCKYCRTNLKTNFKNHPLRACHLASREAFSKYVYELHEIVNKLLGKTSGLSYCDVRERYEHFRARCTDDPNPRMLKVDSNNNNNSLNNNNNNNNNNKTNKRRGHKGCTEPLYGKYSKCVMKIVPQDAPTETLSIDRQCIKRRE
jgi:hypothetical protein